MKPRKNDSASGFTLIEVIITLVVIAIVAAMMTAYFGTSITQSSLPIFRLNAVGQLNEILEKISAQYGQYPHWRPNTAYAAGSAGTILPTTTKRTGLLYTSSGGTSGAAEPMDWLANLGTSITDNAVTWTLCGPAPTLAPLSKMAWRSQTSYSANSIVINGGYQYVTSSGGTSGSGSTPNWAAYTTIGSTPPNDGTITTWRCSGQNPTSTWTCSGANPGATGDLQTFIGVEGADKTLPNDTVSYRVMQNRFIKFDASNQEVNIDSTPSDPAYGRYLKVTISLSSNPTGEALTTLFVRR